MKLDKFQFIMLFLTSIIVCTSTISWSDTSKNIVSTLDQPETLQNEADQLTLNAAGLSEEKIQDIWALLENYLNDNSIKAIIHSLEFTLASEHERKAICTPCRPIGCDKREKKCSIGYVCETPNGPCRTETTCRYECVKTKWGPPGCCH